MPPHRADPRIDSCPELQPSSDATPCLWHGDVEGIHEGRGPSGRGRSGGGSCWLVAVQMLANHCHTACETGQVSMTWLRLASWPRHPW